MSRIIACPHCGVIHDQREKRCVKCQKIFIAKRSTARFCSDACRVGAHKRAGRRAAKIQDLQRLIQLYESGATLSELAKLTKVSKQAISLRFKRHGVVTRRNAGAFKSEASKLGLTVEEYFLTLFDVNTITGCWEWKGQRDAKGYGRFYFEGRLWGAHRVSWKLRNGEIPDGLWALHKCDNPPCVNPDHLFLGTHEDNMRDMVNKGRAKGGFPRFRQGQDE